MILERIGQTLEISFKYISILLGGNTARAVSRLRYIVLLESGINQKEETIRSFRLDFYILNSLTLIFFIQLHFLRLGFMLLKILSPLKCHAFHFEQLPTLPPLSKTNIYAFLYQYTYLFML